MESLDLSFNLLTGESVPSLHKLFNSFPHLKSLKLKQVGLTADSLYTSQNFSFGKCTAQHLFVRKGEHAVELDLQNYLYGFTFFFFTDCIETLDVSNNQLDRSNKPCMIDCVITKQQNKAECLITHVMRGVNGDTDSRFRFQFRKAQHRTDGNINRRQPSRYNVGSLRNEKIAVLKQKWQLP